MLKKLSTIALSLMLLGGCATPDQETISKLQVTLNYAKGVYAGADALVTAYNSRAICGTPGAPTFLCRDLNTSEVGTKAVMALKITIDETQIALNRVATQGLNEAVLISTLLSVAANTLVIIDMFNKTDVAVAQRDA